MKTLQLIMRKAASSPIYLWLFNRLMWRVIPFNHPHRVRISSIQPGKITAVLPYVRKNRNHLKGMHACALATVCEYVCGIGLIANFRPSAYRLILKSLTMEYHLQAKTDIQVTFTLPPDALRHILENLEENGVVLHSFRLDGYNLTGQKVCSAEVTWQLKQWSLVKHRA